MIKLNKDIEFSIPVLWKGLENDWISLSEVVEFINNHNLSLDEDMLVDLNVCDDKKCVLDIFSNYMRLKNIKDNEYLDRIWRYLYLDSVYKLDISMKDKLHEIEIIWSRLNYPHEWKEFIYYMPNQCTNSLEDVYILFENYLNNEKKVLSKIKYSD